MQPGWSLQDSQNAQNALQGHTLTPQVAIWFVQVASKESKAFLSQIRSQYLRQKRYVWHLESCDVYVIGVGHWAGSYACLACPSGFYSNKSGKNFSHFYIDAVCIVSTRNKSIDWIWRIIFVFFHYFLHYMRSGGGWVCRIHGRSFCVWMYYTHHNNPANSC